MHQTQTSTPQARGTDIVVFAVWTGLLAGLVEGAGMLSFQELGWLNWNMAQGPVSAEIIWISAAFCAVFFGAVGLSWFVAAKIFPRLLAMRYGAWLLAFLLWFDWLALSGRIRHLGAFALAAGLATAMVRWYAKRENAVAAFCRRTLPWLAAAALLAAAGIESRKWYVERKLTAALPAAAAAAPNVLVIVVDTLRADHLSSYGYPRATSPNMDRLAREGVLFENAFATSSWTLPAHGSLVTGRYNYEHQAEQRGLDARFPTIGEAMQKRGYRTGAFSANSFFFSRKVGFGRGFIRFEDYFHSTADMAARTLYGRKFSTYVLRRFGYEDVPARKMATDVNRGALKWIAAEPYRPFFVFLNYFDTHDPYLPPAPWRGKFSQIVNPGGILNTFALRYYPKMTPDQLQGEIDAYDGAIAYVDDQIGKLLGELEKSGRLQNTIVVLTSDHGELLGEHGLFLHRNALYREVIQVPLVIHWPGRVPGGIRVGQPVTNAAVPATLMDLLGTTGPSEFPEVSLTALWKNPAPHADWPWPLAEMAQFPFEPVKREPAYHGAMKSLVTPQWQYITNEKLGEELFDWVKDPREASNLVGTPEGQLVAPDLAGHLKKRVSAVRK